MTVVELRNFLATKMSITRLYQPVILLSLLENGGSVSSELVAQRCADLGEQPSSYFLPRINRYPREILEKAGVIQKTSSDSFQLSCEISAASSEDLDELVSICKARLAKIKSKS